MFLSEFLAGESSHERNNSNHQTTLHQHTRCWLKVLVHFLAFWGLRCCFLDVMLYYGIWCYALSKKSYFTILHSVMSCPVCPTPKSDAVRFQQTKNIYRRAQENKRKERVKLADIWAALRQDATFWTTFYMFAWAEICFNDP